MKYAFQSSPCVPFSLFLLVCWLLLCTQVFRLFPVGGVRSKGVLLIFSLGDIGKRRGRKKHIAEESKPAAHYQQL